MTSPTEEYKVIKPLDLLVAPHPRERVVYIKRTLKNLNFGENGSIEECVFLGCNIVSMEIKKAFGFETELTFRKCVFYGCTIDSMEIKGLKDISGIYFVNCKIQNLKFNDVYAAQIYFGDCEINDSTFKFSILPGLTFSKFEQERFEDIIDKVITGDREKAKEAKNQIRRYSSKNKHKRKSEIRSSKFLFCEINELYISNTELAKTNFKHSNIEYPIIKGNVEMRGISLEGTKIYGGCFKYCKLKDIKIKNGFLVPQLAGFIREIVAVVEFSLRNFIGRFSKKKSFNRIFKGESADIDIWRKVINFKKPFKKLLYKIPFGAFLADRLSSTEIKQTEFEEVNFSEDPLLARQIDDFKIIHNMKKKHPILAFFLFFTSNYRRSFMRFIFVSFCCIWIFSGIYCRSTFTDDIQNSREFGHKLDYIDKFGYPEHPFYLSIEVYLGITTYPLKAKNESTKAWIIFERILGYGALASLLGILLAPLALANYKKKREDDG